MLARLLFFGAIGVLLWAALDLGVQPTRSAQRPSVAPLIGLSVPSKVAAIGPEQSGSIVEMPVADGMVVAVGDVVCRLSSRLESLEVERLRVLSESDVAIRRAQKVLDSARDEESRLRQLEAKEIASGSDLQDTELEVIIAEFKLEEARTGFTVTGNELAQARERLEQRTLRSPLNGVVTRRFKHPGETIKQLEPVIEVVSLDPLWVEFECPLTEQESYRPGSVVAVAPAIGAGEERTGTVIHVSMQANPASHTFMVRAAVPNPKLDWKAGLKMLVQLADGAGPPDVVTPRPPGRK